MQAAGQGADGGSSRTGRSLTLWVLPTEHAFSWTHLCQEPRGGRGEDEGAVPAAVTA